MIPLNCKSLRTTSVKSVAWVFAASLREAKSATATRAFSARRPVPVRNQAWAEAWLARIRNNAAARIALDRLKSPITPTSRIHLIWIDGAGKHVSPAHPQVEIERDDNVGARIVVWQGRHGVGAQHSAQSRVVHREIAACLRDVHVLHSAVARDGEGDHAMSAAVGEHARVNRVL